ncbi:unnamed protein product [Coregonus sp. 'balchen']|nr:unnamed protein product [Coregonus sp. 'balchen']
MRDAIGEALSNSEVANRIWVEPSNGCCADCGATKPEWAAINLCVVVCKRCAGEHRGLGPSISKVRSLKMDRKVWTEELIQVYTHTHTHTHIYTRTHIHTHTHSQRQTDIQTDTQRYTHTQCFGVPIYPPLPYPSPVPQVFLLLGNKRLNGFWAANVPLSELLSPTSCSEDRRRFISSKYRQGKYRKYHPLYGNQRELNNVRSTFI